jgi:hypothetical protein
LAVSRAFIATLGPERYAIFMGPNLWADYGPYPCGERPRDAERLQRLQLMAFLQGILKHDSIL